MWFRLHQFNKSTAPLRNARVGQALLHAQLSRTTRWARLLCAWLVILHASIVGIATSAAQAQSAPPATPAAPGSPAPGSPVSDAVVLSNDTCPKEALTQKIAVWRFDALGIEAELVTRLETLFRSELDRLAKQPMPVRRDIDRAVTGDLRECTGEEKCLTAIGKKLGVDVVVTGTVGAVGENYVLSIKAVDVRTGTQLRRISSDPLRGSPDELIDSVRVAAYRLLAPEQIYGGILMLSDLVGGNVLLDGKSVGKTPLTAPLGKLPLGPHKLRVEAVGYAPFEEAVEVRFQKTTRVVVRLVLDTAQVVTLPPVHKTRTHWYSNTWVIVGIGAAAIFTGLIIGDNLQPKAVSCTGSNGC